MNDADLKSFTSRKLDLMSAINSDTRLKMSARVVAHELLQYASPEGEIFPSQELIGRTIDLKPRMVKYCIAALQKAGWIEVRRPSRTKSNRYYFDASQVDGLKARRQMIRDELAAMRGNTLPLKSGKDVQSIAPHDVQSIAPARGNTLPPNTSGYHLEGNTLSQGHDKKDIEVGVYAHARPEKGTGAAAHSHPPQPIHTPPPAQASRFGTVDPMVSLDALEIEMQERAAKRRRREYQE